MTGHVCNISHITQAYLYLPCAHSKTCARPPPSQHLMVKPFLAAGPVATWVWRCLWRRLPLWAIYEAMLEVQLLPGPLFLVRFTPTRVLFLFAFSLCLGVSSPHLPRLSQVPNSSGVNYVPFHLLLLAGKILNMFILTAFFLGH